MPPLMLLLILFVIGTIAGAFRAYRLISASREPDQRPGALYRWSEEPLPSWRYEPYATGAILIHTLSVLVLGFLALGAASNPGILSNPLLADDPTMIALVWFIQCGSLALVGYLVGALLIAFPLIIFRRKSISFTITGEGIALGQNFLPWRWFSRYSVDSAAGILRLYSAFSPDLPSVISKPPASVSLVDLAGLIREYLPSGSSEGRRAWYRTKTMLLPTMFLVCLIAIGLGWLAAGLTRELALFLIALLTNIQASLGGLILNRFAFGVLIVKGDSSKQQSVDG